MRVVAVECSIPERATYVALHFKDDISQSIPYEAFASGEQILFSTSSCSGKSRRAR